MFGKKAKAQAQKDMLAETQKSNQLFQQALTKADTESPLELAKEGEQTNWINQTNSPDFDVTKVSGMSPYLNLFNRAKSNDLSDETPLPAAASWGGTPNASLAEALKSQGARSREQEAAGGLQAGFAAKDASMRGDTFPLLNMQNSRNMGLMDALNSRSMGLNQMRQQYAMSPSLFSQFLLQGLAGGSQIGAAYAGRHP